LGWVFCCRPKQYWDILGLLIFVVNFIGNSKTMQPTPPSSYYTRLAAAYVRGKLLNGNGQYAPDPDQPLAKKKFEELSQQEQRSLLDTGLRHGFKMQRFRQTGPVTLHEKVIGALRGIKPDNLLHLHAGHGLFLWRLLDEFPFLMTTSIEPEARHVEVMQTVQRGGVANLRGVCSQPFDLTAFHQQHFDVGAALQVLDFAPDPEWVAAEICRVVRRFLFVSVAKGRNSHPQCRQQFDESALRQLFERNGVHHIKVEAVDNYWLLVGRK
jgi:hypothetical protein